MKNFIEVPYNGKTAIVNVSNISAITQEENTCIHLVSGENIDTVYPYREIISLINEAQGEYLDNTGLRNQ